MSSVNRARDLFRTLGPLFLCLCGCKQSSVVFERATVLLKPTEGPEWTGAQPGEPTVARVNGLPIPAGRLERAMAKYGAGANPREVLQALIVEEALAQRAAQQGVKPEDLRSTYERLLVRRWLQKKLVEEMQPEGMSERDLEPLWRIPSVRAKYDRLAYFVVQDYQWICCDGSPANCSTKDAEACFLEGEAAMLAVKAAVEAFQPDSEDLPFLVEDLKVSAPRLAYQEYEFAYDERKRIQKGRRVFDDAVVNAVVTTPEGQFAKKPVRSRYGWHLPYVKEVHPEVHKDLSDPEVRLELARTFITYLRQRRLIEILAELIPAEGFLFRGKHFEGFKRTSRPLFDVEIYEDALQVWAREKSETEGL